MSVTMVTRRRSSPVIDPVSEACQERPLVKVEVECNFAENDAAAAVQEDEVKFGAGLKSELAPSRRPFSCPFCDRKFPQRSDAKIHASESHARRVADRRWARAWTGARVEWARRRNGVLESAQGDIIRRRRFDRVTDVEVELGGKVKEDVQIEREFEEKELKELRGKEIQKLKEYSREKELDSIIKREVVDMDFDNNDYDYDDVDDDEVQLIFGNEDPVGSVKCFYCDFRHQRSSFVESHVTNVHETILEGKFEENRSEFGVEESHFESEADEIRCGNEKESHGCEEISISVDKGRKVKLQPFALAHVLKLFNRRSKNRFSHENEKTRKFKREKLDSFSSKSRVELSKSDSVLCNLIKSEQNPHHRRLPEIDDPFDQWHRDLGVKHRQLVPCPDCPFVGASENKTKAHRRNVHVPKQYACTECDHRSKTKSNLRLHRRIHERESKKAPSTSAVRSLQLHSPNVVDEKPFKCDQCPYAGRTSYSLRQHSSIHSTERNFVCGDCGANFKRRINLWLHRKWFEKGDTVYCDLCDFSAANEFRLKKHKREKHRKKSG